MHRWGIEPRLAIIIAKSSISCWCVFHTLPALWFANDSQSGSSTIGVNPEPLRKQTAWRVSCVSFVAFGIPYAIESTRLRQDDAQWLDATRCCALFAVLVLQFLVTTTSISVSLSSRWMKLQEAANRTVQAKCRPSIPQPPRTSLTDIQVLRPRLRCFTASPAYRAASIHIHPGVALAASPPLDPARRLHHFHRPCGPSDSPPPSLTVILLQALDAVYIPSASSSPPPYTSARLPVPSRPDPARTAPRAAAAMAPHAPCASRKRMRYTVVHRGFAFARSERDDKDERAARVDTATHAPRIRNPIACRLARPLLLALGADARGGWSRASVLCIRSHHPIPSPSSLPLPPRPPSRSRSILVPPLPPPSLIARGLVLGGVFTAARRLKCGDPARTGIGADTPFPMVRATRADVRRRVPAGIEARARGGGHGIRRRHVAEGRTRAWAGSRALEDGCVETTCRWRMAHGPGADEDILIVLRRPRTSLRVLTRGGYGSRDVLRWGICAESGWGGRARAGSVIMARGARRGTALCRRRRAVEGRRVVRGKGGAVSHRRRKAREISVSFHSSLLNFDRRSRASRDADARGSLRGGELGIVYGVTTCETICKTPRDGKRATTLENAPMGNRTPSHHHNQMIERYDRVVRLILLRIEYCRTARTTSNAPTANCKPSKQNDQFNATEYDML
ncbi:hypothetical protein DFH06DRAFT_1145904 [Mycena polygramma]|nr:hypothetical protein DFH06DRAFT_1145904 [Mycena polygramma]